ncbi:hypothetical protein E7747_11245 [Duncaniella dubosii]|uniref:Uncharacterized protein n=1 Tax=Duncaniella dubosii TaxID=2518971 RepID=A0A4P7W440_9BACT|nr:hypothetical protein [Duncaniella dubosii]QCD42809.1 hypothetical protein E7747_11245 [Duncaniella dubosii]
MFEETMSGDELLNEYRLDLPEIQAKTLRYDKSDYVTRYLWKHHKQPTVIMTKIFDSSRGNAYLGILVYFQTGIGKTKKWDWSSFHIGLMNINKGVSAIAFYAESKQAIKFNPHFFQRYKERFIEVCDWQTRNQLATAKDIIDVIGIYMKRNLTMTWIETKSVFRDKVHIFGPVNDGVALLQWSKHHRLLQANTFVTMDMLDAKQTQMVEYAKIYFSLSKAQRKKFRFPDFILND